LDAPNFGIFSYVFRGIMPEPTSGDFCPRTTPMSVVGQYLGRPAVRSLGIVWDRL